MNRREQAERMAVAKTPFERWEVLGLKLIGYWTPDKATPPPPGYLWPGDHVDLTWDATERARVVAYLKENRRSFVAYAGLSFCRLCKEKAGPLNPNRTHLEPWEANGSAEFTDGKFIWPEGYLHYVEDHMVRPPQEFIDHVLRGK